jgi:hypothetical protein
MPVSISTTTLTFNDATTQTTAATVIPSGTIMLFAQTAAPTGFTKLTNLDNYALRVVSGTASTGGSVGFTTAFGTPTVNTGSLSAGATTLTTAQIPSHTHNSGPAGWPNDIVSPNQWVAGSDGFPFGTTTLTTTATGGGGSHTHTIGGSATATINVLYVDVIRASKD